MEQEIHFKGNINIQPHEGGGRLYLSKFLMKLMGVDKTTPVSITPKKDSLQIKIKEACP